MSALLVFIGAVLALGAWLAAAYHALVSLRAGYRNAFARIEVQLRRRHDLILNIMETARAYPRYERETLRQVASARDRALNALEDAAENPGAPGPLRALGLAEGKLGSLLGGLRVRMETHPDLKDGPVMTRLGQELTSADNRIACAREAYNDSATAYNFKRNSFPTKLAARLLGHGRDAALLVLDDDA